MASRTSTPGFNTRRLWPAVGTPERRRPGDRGATLIAARTGVRFEGQPGYRRNSLRLYPAGFPGRNHLNRLHGARLDRARSETARGSGYRRARQSLRDGMAGPYCSENRCGWFRDHDCGHRRRRIQRRRRSGDGCSTIWAKCGRDCLDVRSIVPGSSAARARPGSAARSRSACRAASIRATPARPISRSAARSRRRCRAYTSTPSLRSKSRRARRHRA